MSKCPHKPEVFSFIKYSHYLLIFLHDCYHFFHINYKITAAAPITCGFNLATFIL